MYSFKELSFIQLFLLFKIKMSFLFWNIVIISSRPYMLFFYVLTWQTYIRSQTYFWNVTDSCNWIQHTDVLRCAGGINKTSGICYTKEPAMLKLEEGNPWTICKAWRFEPVSLGLSFWTSLLFNCYLTDLEESLVCQYAKIKIKNLQDLFTNTQI